MRFPPSPGPLLDHPESYHSFMWNNLFKFIDIQPSNVHILNGNAPDLKLECDAYEKKIAAVGGIELFLGGIGTDGHIAFNEPGSSIQSRTRVKTLAYETIVANARFFGGDISKVPKMALTVGVGTIMDAREVLIIVTGQHKAVALEKCIEQGVCQWRSTRTLCASPPASAAAARRTHGSFAADPRPMAPCCPGHMWTLSAVQMHKCACIVCDDDATGELRVRTVRYFRGLEKVSLDLQLSTATGNAADGLSTPNGRQSVDQDWAMAVAAQASKPTTGDEATSSSTTTSASPAQ